MLLNILRLVAMMVLSVNLLLYADLPEPLAYLDQKYRGEDTSKVPLKGQEAKTYSRGTKVGRNGNVIEK